MVREIFQLKKTYPIPAARASSLYVVSFNLIQVLYNMLIKEIVVRTVTVCVNHFLGEAPRIVRVNEAKKEKSNYAADLTQVTIL